MVSRRKFITTIIVVIILTALLTFTVSNLLTLETGDKVIISKSNYNQLRSISIKYNKHEYLQDYVKKNFLFEADEEKMMEGSLKGMIDALDDRYSEYMTKKDFDSFMEHTEGSYQGIGVYITPSEDNYILVISPIEDTPAEKAGIKTGDKIIKIDGIDFTAEEMDKAVGIMKGTPGTDVTITVLREKKDGTKETIDFPIKREIIRIKTIKSYMMQDKIGYIRITTFDKQTDEDFNSALNELQKQDMKGLVIDLRYNPGGLVDVTRKITDKLIGKGIVTYTQTKDGERKYYESDKNKIDIPLVVLVNEGSASASEILSGAVKDTKSGILVGTKTFGKGIVQSIMPMKDGTGIKMTISEYFTPNGINIHGIGIEPDVVIEMPEDALYGYEYYDQDIQLQKAVEIIEKKLE